MFNRGERSALGASVLLATNDDAFRFGLKGRYRRWLTPDVPLDIAPGVLIYQADQDLEIVPRTGFTGHVGLSWRDWIGGFVQGELLRAGSDIQLGIRLGSWPGAIGFVLPVIWAGALSGSDDS